jgi:hypothetical protein
MNQDQQPRRWWKDNWPVLALLATVIVIAATGILGYWRSWQRPLWDWLDLLIIPLVLALGAFWFNNQTRKSERELARRERENELERAQRDRENDREIAQDRVQEEALQRYLDRMQELILDKGLRRSEKDAEIRSVARARTLAVLRSLDGNRKGQVVRFLYEADLIGKEMIEQPEQMKIEAIIDLREANLSHADLSGATLIGVYLGGANLSDASLRGTILSRADLRADLKGADLGVD